MAIPFKKFGYTINPITDEIETPQIFLVNKRLKKIGELYPVDGLKITINEVNQPDEVSFVYYKMNNDKECPYFNKIDDLSVIQVGDYGFFEVSINKKEDVSVSKTVTAQSLGIAELSQINATLEINTEDDMSRSGYSSDYPTIFYREVPIGTDSETAKKIREASLLNRILSYAPHYKIGFVSPSLKYVQRTFSWSDTDIVSIFNDVATEINCIFDISVTIGENGNVERIVNVYDMQYCDNCYNLSDIASPQTFRNIINGVCQNCGSSAHVRDIGDDTNIYISTDNLSDEITIEGDKDSIKNCFKVTGGDDTITAAVQGINMSGNRIMMFSDAQINAMSTELIGKLNSYKRDYEANIDDYENLLETQYNLYDIILYLQSGKMPLLETDVTTTLEALISVVKQITTYYNNKFYISSWDNYGYSATKTSIRNLFTTFMPQGYSFTIETDNITTTSDYEENTNYHWYGSIKVYSTGNKDDYYTLYVTENSGTYIRYGETDTPISYVDTGSVIANFSVTFNFADKNQSDYISYLEQHTAYLLSETDLTYDNEKAREWDKYSYNRLVSYYDGFETCLDVINDMLLTDSENEILLNMKENYQRIQSHIKSQMDYLQDQIFALYSYLGDFSSIGAKDFIDSNGNITYELRNYSSVSNVFSHMIDSSYKGGYSYNSDGTINMNSFRPNEFIGTKPFKCKKCGSVNVSVVTDDNSNNNVCSNCGSTTLYTYLDIMQDIVNSYQKYGGKTVVSERQRLQNLFNIETYINNNNLYSELCSFIREDVYNNSNYISDGLSNAQIIQKARELKAKAEQELSKSCMNQYTVTSTISAIIAQKSFVYNGVIVNDDYSKFMVNNYVRVNIDNEIYKMRIASIGLTFPITDKVEVTFTNATKYNNGLMSDISSIIQNASSMSSSYNYVATQAEKGETASVQFDTLKREGLNAALMAVKGGRDQDVVIDNHGILLRKKIQETDSYSPYQMKLINRNIVMTDDNWQTAKLAIGLGTYKGIEYYGVWCDLLVGDLTVTKNLHVINDKSTVIIDENGITLDGGAIKWINKGVADIVKVYYAVSSSSTTHPAENSSEWKETFTGQLNNNYLWSKTVVTDTTGKQTITYNCLGNSPDGIKSTKKQYYLSTSKTSVTGGTWLDYQPTWAGSGYVWTRTHIEYISGATKDVQVVYDKGLTESLKDFSTFKKNVDTALGTTLPTTEIGSDYIISPKIGGGYLYIASGNYSVEIDPNHGSSETALGYIFCIRNKNNFDRIMSVDKSGNAFFKGKIMTEPGSQITLDGDTIVSSGFSLSTDKLYGELLVLGGSNTGGSSYGLGKIQLEDITGHVGVTINGNGIGTFKDVLASGNISASNSLHTNELYFNEVISSCGFKDKVTFNSGFHSVTSPTFGSGLILNNASAGYGIKHSNGNNIIRGNNSADVYIGGGSANAIWLDATNIYYTNKAPVASGSDKRIKHDITALDENHTDFIMSLKPCSYKFNDGTSNRTHWGFIADELEESMLSTTGDSGVFVKMPKDGDTEVDLDDPSTYICGIRYSELIAPMVKTIQCQQQTIQNLNEEVSRLKEDYQRDINELRNELAELKSRL